MKVTFISIIFVLFAFTRSIEAARRKLGMGMGMKMGMKMGMNTGSDIAPTEPAPTEPAPTEPAPTEPAPTDPTVNVVADEGDTGDGCKPEWSLSGPGIGCDEGYFCYADTAECIVTCDEVNSNVEDPKGERIITCSCEPAECCAMYGCTPPSRALRGGLFQ